MKICYVGDVQSNHTVKWMGYFVEQGHEVHAISNTVPRDDMPRGVVLHLLPRYLAKFPVISNFSRIVFFKKVSSAICDISGIIFTRKVINKLKPDVMHCFTLYGFWGALSGFHPMVVFPYGSDLLIRIKESLRIRLQYKFICSKADALISDSLPLRDAAVALGVPADRNHFVYMGVDRTQFNLYVDRNKTREMHGFGDAHLIFSPRGARVVYNIDTIILSIPEVLKELPEAKFLFAFGWGDKGHELRKLAADLCVEDSVRFVESVTYQEMPFYYAASDVCISVPSSDSMTQVLPEAMACGVPVIASDIPMAKGILTHEENVFIVPPRDPQALSRAILVVLRNKELRQRIVESALKLVDEKFDYHKNMARMESIYQSLCREDKR
ncbi:glycosyltransferase family 4 protein [Chloroflexota bacterium]